MSLRAPLMLLALAACGTPDLALEHPGGRVDTEHRDEGAFPGLIALPNWDDDDLDGVADFDAPAAADDERVPLTVPADALSGRAGQDRVLVLAGDREAVRVWYDGEPVLGAGGPDRWVLPDSGEDVDLEVEVGAPLARAVLTLQRVSRSGKVRDEVDLAVTGAPLILNHHLQPAEQVWVMRVDDGGWDNLDMVADLQAIFGEHLSILEGRQFREDVWVQDEPEFGTFTAPGARLDLVVDSVRNRGLDRFPESLAGPGTGAATFGTRSRGSTYDSFGNLEVTPPLTADGVDYPFGRIYYGSSGMAGPDNGLRTMLDSQKVQRPFTFDTTWLCVGHVDEFTSFVPDPSAPRGFRLLVTDVDAAYELLDSLDPETPLPRYAPSTSHGYATLGELAGDTGLRRYNEGLQTDHIDPALAILRDELDLTDEEIVLIPGIFERWTGCGAAALIPGVVNLLIADLDGTPQVVMADPYLRADLDDPDSDPFIAEILARMPEGLDVHFVDNWNVYHLGLGEVHCGTNTRRTPEATWWTDALHLLEAP